ncbi:MAG: hypothetical protein ACK450_05145 [Sphingomonadales bacterium]
MTVYIDGNVPERATNWNKTPPTFAPGQEREYVSTLMFGITPVGDVLSERRSLLDKYPEANQVYSTLSIKQRMDWATALEWQNYMHVSDNELRARLDRLEPELMRIARVSLIEKRDEYQRRMRNLPDQNVTFNIARIFVDEVDTGTKTGSCRAQVAFAVNQEPVFDAEYIARYSVDTEGRMDVSVRPN